MTAKRQTHKQIRKRIALWMAAILLLSLSACRGTRLGQPDNSLSTALTPLTSQQENTAKSAFFSPTNGTKETSETERVIYEESTASTTLFSITSALTLTTTTVLPITTTTLLPITTTTSSITQASSHDTTRPVQGQVVYRTPYGKRYHLDPDCGGKNSYAISLDQAKNAGLTPCKKCAQ